MAAEHRPQTYTVEEYFELEKRNPEICHEYVDGYIYMIAGGSLDYDAIKANIQGILWAFLRGKPCRAYSSDAKVHINEKRYFHPDVTVTCDPRDRGTVDLIRSPQIVFEVLSPSTEMNDRTWKMQSYLALPTLKEYILVSANTMKMEMYRREAGKWVYYIFNAEDELELASIDFHFPVKEAYIDVQLEENTSENISGKE